MKFKFRNKIIEIKDVKECKGAWKAVGLMFSKQENAHAMLFRFKKPVKMPIHSLFCPEFLAIWIIKNRVIDYKFVKKASLSIKPSSAFDCLLEIPLSKRYKNVLRFFA